MAYMSVRDKLGAIAKQLGEPWTWSHDYRRLWRGPRIAYYVIGPADEALAELTAISRAVLAVVDKEQ